MNAVRTRNRWWIVAASVVGFAVGSGVINVFVFATFLKPVTEATGLTRGQLSSALLFNTLLNAIGLAIFGMLCDRVRVRTILLPGIALYAASIAAYAGLSAHPLVVFGLFGLAGFLGAAQSPIGYLKVVGYWFDRDRGLAFGLIVAGTGIGGFIVPQIARWMIAAFGWRMAYVGIGLLIFLVAYVPVAIFLREPEWAVRRRAARAADAPALPGIDVDAALASWRFWILAAASLVGAMVPNAILTHSIALLTDRGISPAAAGAALGFGALATIAGRILSGYCLDKVSGRLVAIVVFLVPMSGIALLMSGATGAAPLLGVVLCGLGLGAEGDVLPFFVTRYFGLRAYGTIYGYLFAIFVCGIGVGPFLMGRVFDATHSYAQAFVILQILLAVVCPLIVLLGRYPFPFRTGDEYEAHGAPLVLAEEPA